MKYQLGETVILLDTTFKPAAMAYVKEFNEEMQKYLIEYRIKEGKKPEELWVSQERLTNRIEILQPSIKD